MVKVMYKCRLCGEEYECRRVGEDLALEAAVSLLHDDGQASGRIRIERHHAHRCKDNSIGYADFIGFKQEEDIYGNEI